jgi:hypothetical protein
MSATQKHKYVIKAGFRHNQGTPEEVGPGGIVELTEEQAAAFKDKLAPYHGESEEGDWQTNEDADAFLENLTPFQREVLKHRLLADESKAQAEQKAADDLPGKSIKQLTALPEWAQVPEPKPTKKADILAAIRAVRAAPEEG